MGGNNCMCLWNQHETEDQQSINFNYFWLKVCEDVCGHRAPQKDLAQQICRMYSSKSLILTVDENNYVFTIGIVPQQKFEVLIRLELENAGIYLEMNSDETNQLFMLLHQTFCVNVLHPSTLAATAITSLHNIEKINVRLFNHNMYKLCVNDKHIFISTNGLLKLMENEKCIKTLMKSYESKTTWYQNSVFKLLNLCCKHLQNSNDIDTRNCENNDNSTVTLTHNNRGLAKNINLSEILNDLMCSPCDCLPTTFIIETKVHFQHLISLWIGAYYESQLMSESARIDTFKKKWPHKFINVQTLAKSGFFYVGPFDRVQCVFCKTILGEWQPYDTVTGEHNRFAPFCSSSLTRIVYNIPKQLTV